MPVHKNVNKYFFDDLNQNSCYALGMIASDGCVIKRDYGSQYVSIHAKDYDWVLLFKNLLNSDHKITTDKGQWGHIAYRIMIGSNYLCNRLSELGIHPNKSLDFEYPDIPEEFNADFMRGMFDGDGCFSIRKRGGNCKDALRVSMCGPKNFLETWKSKLNSIGIDTNAKVRSNNDRNTLYAFHFSNDKALKFGKYIYYNDSVPKLERKYDIYKKFI